MELREGVVLPAFLGLEFKCRLRHQSIAQDGVLTGPIDNNQPNLPPFQPYQNFSVTIPASWAKGAAQLNVAHFTLIGVRHFLEIANATY
ncbi:hypothetical protein M378DRAFT_17828 [Amanita muscaria Koide BX008]|uniref:Uncharacterized protein n=1 Tax=Amanita muscaria (strain Koide BX008) TaxID=946122 RepID=A0A0C2WG40_AMAMK|nr:hypothetical protein M378DRAFT_17828 [Amanita muscaria Koide BX008]